MTVWLYGARTHQNNKIMALDNGLQYQLQKLSISTAKFGMAKPEAGRVHFDSISIESKWDVQVETYLTINFSSPQESRTTPLYLITKKLDKYINHYSFYVNMFLKFSEIILIVVFYCEILGLTYMKPVFISILSK